MLDIAQIKSEKINKLSISYDTDDGMILLFIPDEDQPMHYHINLNTAEYISLYSFLSKYAPYPAEDN